MPLLKIAVMGNLGADPKVFNNQDGSISVSLSIAVNGKRRDQNGEYVDHVDWVQATAYQKTAEVIAQYFHKGDTIYIEGTPSAGQYTPKNGGDLMPVLKVRVHMFTFCGRQKEDNAGQQQAQQPQQRQPAQQPRQQPQQAQGHYPQQGNGYGQQRAPVPQPQTNNFDEDVPF